MGKGVGAALTKQWLYMQKVGGSLKPERWLNFNFLGPDKESPAVL